MNFKWISNKSYWFIDYHLGRSNQEYDKIGNGISVLSYQQVDQCRNGKLNVVYALISVVQYRLCVILVHFGVIVVNAVISGRCW